MLSFLLTFFLSFSPTPAEQITSAWGLAMASVVHADTTTDSSVAVASVVPTVAVVSAVPAKPTAKRVNQTNKRVRKAVVASGKKSSAARLATKSLLFNLDPNSFGGMALAAPARLGADAVVAKVQAFYKDTETLRAKFRQTVTNTTFGRQSISDGYVWIKKPGKMRWDYYSKKKPVKVTKSFISDGQTLWAVFHQDMQFFKQSTKDNLLPVAITFLAGKGDLSTDFVAAIDTRSGYGAKSDYVVKLTPRKPNAQYKTLWLVVDPSDYRVKQSVVLNSKGDTNQFAFYEGNTKATVKDSFFVFNEKANKKFRLINPDKAPGQ